MTRRQTVYRVTFPATMKLNAFYSIPDFVVACLFDLQMCHGVTHLVRCAVLSLKTC